MSTIETTIHGALARALSTLGISPVAFSLEYPTDMAHGDLASNVAMVAAKESKSNPRALAEQIALELGHIDGVQKIEIAGPGFINFTYAPSVFGECVREVKENPEAWGKNETLKGQTWVIEHASPNPNKAMHIGHLRNCVTGMALIRLTRASGAEVIADAIDNNRGIAIAKLMWGFLRFARKDNDTTKDLGYWYTHQGEWHTPKSKGALPDRFIDELYIAGSADAESSKESEQKVRDMVVDWEARDEATWALWRLVLEYSHEGQARTLKRLGSEFDHWWHEHEHYERGKELVSEGIEKGVFKELPEGGVLTNLEQYGLSDTIVQKRDGTSLYITQDIALTKLKKETWHPNKLVWVVGPDQSLAMQQVFAVCEQLGIGAREEFFHAAYGYMSIKDVGKMSSRKGTVLYVDEVIDETRDTVLALLKDRNLEDADTLAEEVALGAIKYAILRSSRTRDIAFDKTQAVTLEGDSGPYLQYAYTRALSVLKKAQAEDVDSKNWTSDVQFREHCVLERLLVRFPRIVSRAQEELEPHYVTTYLTELAGEFNSWYAQEKIVDPTDPSSPFKVALTEAFTTTMKNGLSLLGIGAPEQM